MMSSDDLEMKLRQAKQTINTYQNERKSFISKIIHLEKIQNSLEKRNDQLLSRDNPHDNVY